MLEEQRSLDRRRARRYISNLFFTLASDTTVDRDLNDMVQGLPLIKMDHSWVDENYESCPKSHQYPAFSSTKAARVTTSPQLRLSDTLLLLGRC